MKTPFGLCCCGFSLEDCFNCGASRSPIDFEISSPLQLTLDGFNWNLTNGSWCAGSRTYFSYNLSVIPPIVSNMGTVVYELFTKVAPMSALNTTITLQPKPALYTGTSFYTGGLMAPTPFQVNGGCHWLWNYSRAVHAVGYPMHWSVEYEGTTTIFTDFPSHLEQFEYEPLSPPEYGVNNMWGREYNLYFVDSRCGDLLPGGWQRWRCSNHVYGFIVRLSVVGALAGMPPGAYWWVHVRGFPLFYTVLDVVGKAPNGAPVQALVSTSSTGNGMGIAGPVGPESGYIPSSAGYCWDERGGIPHELNIEYAKKVDCTKDFSENPIELPFYRKFTANNTPDIGVTYPSSIQLRTMGF